MSNKIKIAFVGGPSTGKTTVFEALKKEYEDKTYIIFIDEAARQFFHENQIVDADRGSAEVQAKIQDKILSREQLAIEAKPEMIITDRSVIDPVVYTEVRGDSKGSDELLARVRFWIPTYTHIFLLDPVDVPHINDKIRHESADKRNEIHKAYMRFFKVNDISYELLSGTLSDRIKKVRGTLSIADNYY